MSTATEIAQGQKENQQINAESVVVRDPFLTSWVNHVGGQLAQFRRRGDISYTFIILQDPSINAFAIKGGFVHVNTGLLNFVSSDDELAATLGHEMGHVELRHVVKQDSTSAIIGILASIVSLFALPAAVLGSIGGELASEKYSRTDELQADGYGLTIMSKAGFDPNAAVDLMHKLGVLDPGPNSRADKAFLDHPVPSDRVAHLLGYPELDKPSSAATVSRAIHDETEGRYTYAQALLLGLANPDPKAEFDSTLRQVNYALRESGGLAAPDSRAWTRSILPSDAQRVAAAASLKLAQDDQASAFQQAKNGSRVGELELGDVTNHLGALQGPAGGLQFDAPPGGSPPNSDKSGQQATARALTRDFVAIVNLTDDVFSSAPGVIDANREPIRDMLAPLAEPGPLTPRSAALLPYYPSMTSDIRDSSTRLVGAIADARTAVATLGTAVQYFADEQRALASQADQSSSQPSAEQSREQRLALTRLLAAAESALAQANKASDEMYSSQTITLSANISLLDLYSSPERYAALQRALAYRFPGISTPSYAQAAQLGMPAGDVACGAWLAFETSRPLDAVLAGMRRGGTRCGSLATDNHLMALSLEIAEGLLYEDYDDTPSSQKNPTTQPARP